MEKIGETRRVSFTALLVKTYICCIYIWVGIWSLRWQLGIDLHYCSLFYGSIDYYAFLFWVCQIFYYCLRWGCIFSFGAFSYDGYRKSWDHFSSLFFTYLSLFSRTNLAYRYFLFPFLNELVSCFMIVTCFFTRGIYNYLTGIFYFFDYSLCYELRHRDICWVSVVFCFSWEQLFSW